MVGGGFSAFIEGTLLRNVWEYTLHLHLGVNVPKQSTVSEQYAAKKVLDYILQCKCGRKRLALVETSEEKSRVRE